VNSSHLLSVVRNGESTCKFRDSLSLSSGDDLQGLDDTANRLVLQARIFTFCILSYDAEVDVFVACLETWDVLDQYHGGVGIELLTHGDVEGIVAGSFYGRVEDTLETELVSPEGSYRLVEEVFCVLVAGFDASHVDLFPFDGYIVCLEYRLDSFCYFGTDTITYPSLLDKLVAYCDPVFIPGMSVTVYLPPYFVGLKISDCTEAYAGHVRSNIVRRGGAAYIEVRREL